MLHDDLHFVLYFVFVHLHKMIGAKLFRPSDEAAICMSNRDQKDLQSQLADLRLEHSDLDIAIRALERSGPGNELQIKRLKKKKLQLKDEISRIEDILTPDIIA